MFKPSGPSPGESQWHLAIVKNKIDFYEENQPDQQPGRGRGVIKTISDRRQQQERVHLLPCLPTAAPTQQLLARSRFAQPINSKGKNESVPMRVAEV